eukprot:1896151-Rhodomonas_salina.1
MLPDKAPERLPSDSHSPRRSRTRRQSLASSGPIDRRPSHIIAEHEAAAIAAELEEHIQQLASGHIGPETYDGHDNAQDSLRMPMPGEVLPNSIPGSAKNVLAERTKRAMGSPPEAFVRSTSPPGAE